MVLLRLSRRVRPCDAESMEDVVECIGRRLPLMARDAWKKVLRQFSKGCLQSIPPAVKHSRLIEAFLGAPNGQVLRFNLDEGAAKPVFGAEGVSQLRFDILSEIHAGAEEYCDNLITAFGPEVFYLDIDLSACQVPLNMFAQHQILVPNDVSTALSLEDEFCGNGILDLEECLVPYDRLPN